MIRRLVAAGCVIGAALFYSDRSLLVKLNLGSHATENNDAAKSERTAGTRRCKNAECGLIHAG